MKKLVYLLICLAIVLTSFLPRSADAAAAWANDATVLYVGIVQGGDYLVNYQVGMDVRTAKINAGSSDKKEMLATIYTAVSLGLPITLKYDSVTRYISDIYLMVE